MNARKTVLIVEDEAIIAECFRILVEDAGASVVGIAENGEGAIDMVRTAPPDFLLMDVRLRGMLDGIDAAITIYHANPTVRIDYVAGSTEHQTMERIRRDHPYRGLIKPFDLQSALS